jgi:2-iminobutanoate/2-iminopropanoate deaminase
MPQRSTTVMFALVASLLFCAGAFAAAPEPVFPPGVKPVGPYSPGIVFGDLLYISGQGARDPKGQLPATVDGQVQQTLENVKAVVEAAGLTMEHVVYTQVYLDDIKKYDAMNRVYGKYFPRDPPARSTIAVTRMPTGTPVEISAVAVRKLQAKKIVLHPARKMPVPVTPAVLVGDRAYLTGGLGRDFDTGRVPRQPSQQVRIIMDSASTVLKTVGMDLRNLVAVTIFITPAMPMPALAKAIEEYIPSEAARTIVQTAALPFGAQMQITGVASRELQRHGNCNAIGETMYCSARAGTIKQALDALKQDLIANGSSLGQALAVNVYMDDIDQFAEMNKVYAMYFGKVAPTRTTVQPWKFVAELSLPPATGAPPDDTPRAQVSVIAVHPKK